MSDVMSVVIANQTDTQALLKLKEVIKDFLDREGYRSIHDLDDTHETRWAVVLMKEGE